MRVFALLSVIVFSSRCIAAQSSVAARPVSVYATEPPQEVVRTRSLHYAYSRSDFTPPFRIVSNEQATPGLATPEDAMRTRSIAMETSNIELWLTTWDAAAQSIFHQQLSSQAAIDKQKNLWHAFFSRGQQVLFKRIENRGYVLLTYRVMTPEGQDIGGLELPSVFHKVDNRWLGTQDLASDPLFQESPWMTGKDKAEREAK